MAEWTELEVRALNRYYELHGSGWDGWRNLLPERTRRAIDEKARKLGLSVDNSLKAQLYRKRTNAKHIFPSTCGECRYYVQHDPHGIGVCKERHTRAMFGSEQKVYAHYQAYGLCAYGVMHEDKEERNEETDGKE